MSTGMFRTPPTVGFKTTGEDEDDAATTAPQISRRTPTGGTDTRECYHCHKTGHIAANCPEKRNTNTNGNGGTNSVTTNGNHSSSSSTPKWFCQAPADDLPFDSSLSMVGGFFGGVVPVTKATFRAKDWRACTKCRANVHRSHDCTGTYRHQQGRVMDAVDDSVDFV